MTDTTELVKRKQPLNLAIPMPLSRTICPGW